MKPARHSWHRLYAHLVWATRARAPVLSNGFWAEANEIARSAGARLGHDVLILDGADDHVHVLVALRPDVTIAEVVRILKSKLAHWLRTKGGLPDFHWQSGYAALSVSHRDLDRVRRYIREQKQRHACGNLDPEAEGRLIEPAEPR